MKRGNAPVRASMVAGAALAGGEGRRMGEGAPKPQRRLGGRPLIDHALERLAPQVCRLAVVAHDARDAEAYVRLRADVVMDDESGERQGPLAGVLAALRWARRAAPWCPYVVTVPADAPFLPHDLLSRVTGHLHVPEPEVLTVRRGGRPHWTVAAWSTDLVDPLAAFLADGGRKVQAFAESREWAPLDWPRGGEDPFFNVNTPADLARAEKRLKIGR